MGSTGYIYFAYLLQGPSIQFARVVFEIEAGTAEIGFCF